MAQPTGKVAWGKLCAWWSWVLLATTSLNIVGLWWQVKWMKALGAQGTGWVLIIPTIQFIERLTKLAQTIAETDWMVAAWMVVVAATPAFFHRANSLLDAFQQFSDDWAAVWALLLPLGAIYGVVGAIVFLLPSLSLMALPFYRTFTWLSEDRRQASPSERMLATVRWMVVLSLDFTVYLWFKHLAAQSGDKYADLIAQTVEDFFWGLFQKPRGDFLAFSSVQFFVLPVALLVFVATIVVAAVFVREVRRRRDVPLGNGLVLHRLN